MAGGIDWFRWHHGSVTDPKFQLVARKAQARFGDVVTVWAFMLETASASDARGNLGELDAEAIDFLLGADDGTTQRILDAMQDRGLWDGSSICAWEKRQPKREDDTAAERKRRQREREHELALSVAVTSDESRDDTTSHAASRSVTHGHDRGEERREDISKATPSHPTAKAVGAKSPSIPCPYDAIVDAYHRELPGLPAVVLRDGKTWVKRQKGMRELWGWVLSSRKSDGTRRAETPEQAVEWIGGYFHRASDNDFLMGRSSRGHEHANWQCDLDFLLTEKGMRHVIEKTMEQAA